MTRYCQQRDDHSCGPIALLNIDKFYGHRVTYKDLPKYSKRVGCLRPSKDDVGGTFAYCISDILGRPSRRSWKSAKRFLKDGCILVQTKCVGHYYLLLMQGGVVNTVNCDIHVDATIPITPRQCRQILSKSYRTWYVSKTSGRLE